jgi:hypothetical protein
MSARRTPGAESFHPPAKFFTREDDIAAPRPLRLHDVSETQRRRSGSWARECPLWDVPQIPGICAVIRRQTLCVRFQVHRSHGFLALERDMAHLNGWVNRHPLPAYIPRGTRAITTRERRGEHASAFGRRADSRPPRIVDTRHHASLRQGQRLAVARPDGCWQPRRLV